MAKKGLASVVVVSNAFVGLGKAQARSLGHPTLPLAVIGHPFGSRKREELKTVASQCVSQIMTLVGLP
jgi:hypothetical protein